MNYSEVSIDSEKPYIPIDTSSSRESFLSILDDKNTTIELLRKQLQNQKMQIKYYLQRDLARSKLLELSETCTDQDLDENLPLALAVNDFRKRNGIKSNVHHLYDHMRYIDERLVGSLHGQEFILKQIVTRLFQFLKVSNGEVQYKMDTEMIFKNGICLELFNKLLEATVVLRRKLEAFRICCNRLIVLEDERNIIAEQVYSLPADQKLNCHFIMNMQMEKTKLEKKVKQISKEQDLQKEDMKELSVIEKKLFNLKDDLNSMAIKAGDAPSVDYMVKNLDLEARYLLTMTTHSKNKHKLELATARRLNIQILDRVLCYVHLAVEGKDLANKHLRDRAEVQLFDSIKRPIENAKAKLTNELKRTKRECESLRGELNKLLLERNQLKISNYQLQRDFETIKSDHCRELSSLQQQRDTYLAQVEDLQTIREAYTQLVGKKTEEKTSNSDKNLGKKNMNLTKKLKIMKDIINQQNQEILLQNDFINHMKSYSENKLDWEKNHCFLKYPHLTSSNFKSSCLDIKNKAGSEDIDEELLFSEEVFSWEGDENLNTVSCDHSKCRITKAPSIGCFAVYSQNKKVMKQMIKAVVKEQRSDDDTNTSSFTLEINQSCEEEDMTMKVKDDDEYSSESSQKKEIEDSKRGIYSRNIRALTDNANKMNSSPEEKCLDNT